MKYRNKKLLKNYETDRKVIDLARFHLNTNFINQVRRNCADIKLFSSNVDLIREYRILKQCQNRCENLEEAWSASGNDSHPPFVVFGVEQACETAKKKDDTAAKTGIAEWKGRDRFAEERGCGETVARAKLTRRRIHDAVGEYRRTVGRVRCIGQQVTLKVKQCEGTGETTARTAAETGSE